MFKKYLLTLAILLVGFSNCWIVKENNLPPDDTEFKFTDVEIMTENWPPGIPYEAWQNIHSYKRIYPGTKWCGEGNEAKNNDDLGVFVKADRCCREHDLCGENDIIAAGETKYGLTNPSSYSRLNCTCDWKFRTCLQNTHTDMVDVTSFIIGFIYFNIIGTQCFSTEFNVTGCAKYSGIGNTKCVEYIYDVSSKKHAQWFDVPNFLDN